jgi:hypothetical protein
MTNIYINTQALASNTYNPTYWGGKDKEDCSSKLALASSWGDPIWKMPNTKNGWQSNKW